MERTRVNLEKELNTLVRKFGLDYKVTLVNSNDHRKGWIDQREKIIYINSYDYEEAYKILLHELIEIKMRPLLNKYIRLINVLLDYIQNELYVEKEKVIDELLKSLVDIDF